MNAKLDFLMSMENNLSSFLHPVDPDPEFINTLNQRLARSDQTVLAPATQSHNWLVWMGLGFLAGVLTWILLRRKSR